MNSSVPLRSLLPYDRGARLVFGADDGIRHSVRLLVISLGGDRICAITGFDGSVLPSFGLPRSLP